MHKFGRVASKTERLFRYDGPVIWGISNGGVTPEIQVYKGFRVLFLWFECNARLVGLARQLPQRH